MDDARLDAIEARTKDAMGWPTDYDALVDAAESVPALVAEVRRQNAEISDLRRDIAEADGFVW